MNSASRRKTTKKRPTIRTTRSNGAQPPLGRHVRRSLEKYFSELNGHAPNELYDMVLSEIEQPMFEVVMSHTRGNISKAAEYLGLNRATLRKKREKYGLNQ